MAPEINLDDLDSEESFADKIGESFEWSDFHEPARRYLPEPCLSELITKESIEIELDRFEDELAVKLRGKFKKTYKQFEQYDSSYRRGLALWIHAVAPKIFAIAVQCELDAFKLVLAMEIFRQNLFTDKKLPVRDPALLVDIFSKKVWSTTQLHSFFDKQWRLLVPVFSPDRYDYDLDSECIFPFKLRRTLHKAGAFSSVYRVKIHKGHQLHEELGDVALKELKVPQSNEDNGANDEWDREARALRAINKLDHPHVVKCIAAVRRGESRYFMFPWAEGDSLRDFWNKTSMKGPSQEVILQTITQLLGIADALHQLHNYHEGRRRSLPGNSLSLTIPVIGGGPNSTSATYHMDGDQSEDDDLHSQTDDSIRHGDLKPENILRFTESDAGLGTLKIADMGLAKQHVLATSDRNDKRQITSTRYGTQPYEAPETITAKYGRSRLYDVWSMGCITLEFIIWILYGNERLTNFYNQIAGGPQLPYQYYEIPDPNEPSHAEVHRVVLKWIEHIETNDPECSQDSAIRDLLAIVREKLLVVRLPPTSVSSRSGGRTLAPPALGGASQFRATAEEFRDALSDILEKGKEHTYIFTGKDRSNARPPANLLSPEDAQRSDNAGALRINTIQAPVLSGVLGRPIRADYSLPPLKDWQFPVDNRFADTVAHRVENSTFLPQFKKVPKLCTRCSMLEFWTGGFSLDDNVPDLLGSAQTCDLCRMLRDARREDDTPANDRIRFERKESNLLLAGDPFPVLSFLRIPDARITRHFQIGFPELPKPGSDAFFEILKLWLENCDTDHKDPKNQDRNCTGIPKQRLPTRLIDVGTLDTPSLRLVETQEENIDLSEEYFALSHPWGDVEKYISFSTLRKDPEGTRHELEIFKQAIPYDELPATFRDAVICTRRLGIRYLWIDSICIIQGEDGDFADEAKRMEDVFSGAYCVLAASRANDQHSGFLGERRQRNYIVLQPDNDEQFFICEPIDNFNKDVIQGSLNKRGWVLQERALARRTIYFTQTQTYFECGCGVRCETLARMHNNMADFLGDPRFPSKAMRNPSRALKIEYFQGLYKQYTRLDFTRFSDRPFAIAGLEKRLRGAFDTRGGFGIFDDGDRSHIDNGLFHRSLLWKRSEDDDEVREEVKEGKEPVMKWLEPIGGNVWVPSWSWMAYKGAIDYTDPPYGTADWETKEVIPPWTRGRKDTTQQEVGDIALMAVVRDFNVAGSRPGDCKLTYDRERTTALDGQRAQCVIVAKSKEPKEERMKRFFVLLVVAQVVAEGEEKGYQRTGVGVMLGKFISLGKDGVAAKIV